MSEETTEIQQEAPATEETTPTEAPTPQFTDEQLAAALGVDVEFFTSEVKPNAQNFNKLYSKLNQKSMTLAEREKALKESASAAPPSVDDDDEDVELDARAQKALKKFVEKEYGGYFSTIQEQLATSVSQVIEKFSQKASDVDANRVTELMDEYGLWTKNSAQLEKNLDRVYKLVKAESLDVDAIAEQKAQEKFEKLLEEKGLKDADIVAVKKSPKTENLDNADWRDLDDPAKKFEMLMAKQGIK